jgi:hypothetical protein
MKSFKYFLAGAAFILGSFALATAFSRDSASGTQQDTNKNVVLPGDTLMEAVKKRFGPPDRLTGSGRAFLHYDLSNGDTMILVVSGAKIIGVTHEQKQK